MHNVMSLARAYMYNAILLMDLVFVFSDHNTTKNARQRSLLLCIETNYGRYIYIYIQVNARGTIACCGRLSAVATVIYIYIPYMHMKKVNLYARLTFMAEIVN